MLKCEDNIENIEGSVNDDKITGNASNNIIKSLAGDDIIYASGGSDTIDGGDNTTGNATSGDTVDYSSLSGVTINVQSDNSIIVTKSSGTDTLTNIENLKASGGDDIINGNDNANILYDRCRKSKNT